MINQTQIESILKINGIHPSSPDEEIRSVLLSARYSKDEVDTALMVLRQNKQTKQTRVDGLHKVFRSDDALNPDEISQLLGIDVVVSEFGVRPSVPTKFVVFKYSVILGAGFVLALLFILIYMYVAQVGFFFVPHQNSLAI